MTGTQANGNSQGPPALTAGPGQLSCSYLNESWSLVR